MPINYKEYPSNWQEIREQVLQRDGHKCQFCGLPNYCYVNRKTRQICLKDEPNTTLIILTIAHLKHDHSTPNPDINTLAALCQKCHLQYDMVRHTAKRKYGSSYYKLPTLF